MEVHSNSKLSPMSVLVNTTPDLSPSACLCDYGWVGKRAQTDPAFLRTYRPRGIFILPVRFVICHLSPAIDSVFLFVFGHRGLFQERIAKGSTSCFSSSVINRGCIKIGDVLSETIDVSIKCFLNMKSQHGLPGFLNRCIETVKLKLYDKYLIH